MNRFVLWLTAVAVAGSLPAGAFASGTRQGRVFQHTQAREAQQLAQRECVPLVIHVVSGDSRSMKQVADFYYRRDGIPVDVLNRVVILVIPRTKYAAFAEQLGIYSDSGLRTISAYDLNYFDYQSTIFKPAELMESRRF